MALVIWGTLYCGGVLPPTSPGYGVEELQLHPLQDSRASEVVTQQTSLAISKRAVAISGITHGRCQIRIALFVLDPHPFWVPAAVCCIFGHCGRRIRLHLQSDRTSRPLRCFFTRFIWARKGRGHVTLQGSFLQGRRGAQCLYYIYCTPHCLGTSAIRPVVRCQ